MLLNLIINALEATSLDNGVVAIRCSVLGQNMIIEVMDNGVGMDAPTLKHVFDPFFTSRKMTGQSGVGLGLSISYAIIQQHGGQLKAHSDGPGQGSRFTIKLAVADG